MTWRHRLAATAVACVWSVSAMGAGPGSGVLLYATLTQFSIAQNAPQGDGRFQVAQNQRQIPVRGGAQAQPAGDDDETLGNPDRPQTGQTAAEPINIDFMDVPLLSVIEAIGVKTGKNFEVDPGVISQKVTLVAHHPVPPDLAFRILEALLASKDYEIVETLEGNLYKIVKRGTLPEKLNIYRGGFPEMDGFDDFSIHVVPVQYADAGEVAELLKTVGSKDSRIASYAATNTLIVSDTSDGIRNMLTLLQEIDVPGFQVEMEIFVLRQTRAEILAQQILEVLGDGAAGGAPGQQQPVRRTIPVRARPTPGAPAQAEPEEIGSREETLRLVPDERLNALIVVASAGPMQQVRYLIEQLDTPTPYESNNIRLRELLHADAEAVEEALNALAGTTPRAANEQGGGAAPTGEVQPFEKNIVITRYEPTNSLLITASPQDYKLLSEIIDLMDVPRRQVNVEAIIMEVTINDSFTLSVETAGLTGNDAFGLNNVARLATAIAGGPLALTGPGTVVGIIDGTTDIPVPAGLDDMGNPTGGIELQTIPNVPLLLSALETLTDVEVLSQPNILMVDNEESNIIVGQEVPILNSLSDVDDRSGFVSRSSISRRDVGVQMDVTPQINEGDYVSMEIAVEVSAPVASSIGIDPNEVGATFQKSRVESTVVVRDGQTGIIGGLLREGKNRSVNQAPILGDIPLIGLLFRSKNNTRNKQNLVMLLTPHIVKEGQDLERVTDFRIDEFYDRNIDIILQKEDFFQKIRKKQEKRNNYHPTDRFNPNTGGTLQREFGRGSVER